LSEEGIAKGVRRIVAVTAADASAAISEGQKLAAEVDRAAALPDTELEQVCVWGG
jgi:alanyl-tRNA synthetase